MIHTPLPSSIKPEFNRHTPTLNNPARPIRIYKTIQSIDHPNVIANPNTQSIHNYIVLSIINAFGLFYFYLFTIHFLLFHFPSSPVEILIAILILVFCATTIPSTVLLLHNQPSLQLEYLSTFTIVTIKTLIDFLLYSSSIHTFQYIFPYNYISLNLLSLIPSIHTLIKTFKSPPSLTIHFNRVTI
ncbi:unnamed protein product [Penicillium salamii]|nr:unnamed protein product [Penicillium salamii]